MTCAPRNFRACDAAPMPSKKLMWSIGWLGIRDCSSCWMRGISGGGVVRVVPIAIVGQICPSSHLCPWGFVPWEELWVVGSGLVWRWLPSWVEVVYSVATVVAVRVVAMVGAVAKTGWTVGMAKAVGMMAVCCIDVESGLGERAVCLTCICLCLYPWESSRSWVSWKRAGKGCR